MIDGTRNRGGRRIHRQRHRPRHRSFAVSMKTYALATLISLCVPAALLAGNTVTGVIAVPFQSQRATAIALVQPADYVCATVVISSREKDPLRQAEDVRGAVKQLSAAVAKSPHLQLHDGPLRFYGGGSRPDFASSSAGLLSSRFGGSSLFGASMRVLYKLDSGEMDTFTAAATLRKLIDDLKFSNLTEVHVSGISLAVESPERQRERLLALIGDSADAMKKTFHAEKVTVGGLDGPVLVRQVDDVSVELFIDYQLSVTAGNDGTH